MPTARPHPFDVNSFIDSQFSKPVQKYARLIVASLPEDNLTVNGLFTFIVEILSCVVLLVALNYWIDFQMDEENEKQFN